MFVFNKDDFTAYIKRHLAMDEKQEKEIWVTTENGHKIKLDREGKGAIILAGLGGVLNGQALEDVDWDEFKVQIARKANQSQQSSQNQRTKKPENNVPHIYEGKSLAVRLTDARADRVYKEYLKQLNTGKYNLSAILNVAAQQLSGHVKRDFGKFGTHNVYIEKNPFANEAKKYLVQKRASAADRATVERQLFAMSKLPDIIKNGVAIQPWYNDPQHHKDYDFMVLEKEYTMNDGSTVKVTLDLRKPHGIGTVDAEKKAYNINVQGNRSFQSKKNNIAAKLRNGVGFTNDSALGRIEVVGIRIE